MEKISKHISWEEATKSPNAIRAGLKNTPTPDQVLAMKFTANTCFEPLRQHFQVPIGLTSFFRHVKVNALTPGASDKSQHCKGEAMDIDADVYPASNITNGAIFRWLRANVKFDQLIWEYGNDQNPDWVHISVRRDGKNRGEVLRCRRVKGEPSYSPMK